MKLTPWTKRLIIIGTVAIIIVAMITGNFDAIVKLISEMVD